MRERIVYGVISLLMAAGLLVAVPAFAQTTQTAGGSGAGGGFGGRGMMHGAPGVFGTVTAISGDTITLSSKGYGQNATATTYTVDATNATVTKSGSTSSIGSIAVGDTLMVQGTVSGDTVTATKINDGVGGAGFGGAGRAPGIFGTVSAVNGTTLTVTSKAMVGPNSSSSSSGTTYTVNAANATVMKDGATSTVSAIGTGDTVMVQGTVSGTSVTATMIRDGVVPGPQGQGAKGGGAIASLQGNGEPVIGGSVSAINGDTLTVTNKSNVTYTVDATNATVIVKNATSSISDISTGDNVIVQGTVNGTAVTASSVIDQGAASSSSGGGTGPAMMHGIGGIFGAIGGFFQHIFGFF